MLPHHWILSILLGLLSLSVILATRCFDCTNYGGTVTTCDPTHTCVGDTCFLVTENSTGYYQAGCVNETMDMDKGQCYPSNDRTICGCATDLCNPLSVSFQEVPVHPFFQIFIDDFFKNITDSQEDEFVEAANDTSSSLTSTNISAAVGPLADAPTTTPPPALSGLDTGATMGPTFAPPSDQPNLGGFGGGSNLAQTTIVFATMPAEPSPVAPNGTGDSNATMEISPSGAAPTPTQPGSTAPPTVLSTTPPTTAPPTTTTAATTVATTTTKSTNSLTTVLSFVIPTIVWLSL